MPTTVNPLFGVGGAAFLCLRVLLADFGSGVVLLFLSVNGYGHFLNFDSYCHKSSKLKVGSWKPLYSL